MNNTIPAGYWKDSEGRLIPESMVKPIDRTRDDVVRELVDKAKTVSAVLAEFKAKAFGDIGAFVEMSAEQYGVKLGGMKGNVTLLSFDGRFKIVRQIQEHLVFDERLQAAKQLIDECIQTWTAGSSDEIKALINDAFQVNKEGKINTSRVLGLKRLNITDEKWLRAMQAIADSVQVAGSKPYVRIYERIGDSDQFQAISLDIAAV
ncbi:DUF3164 family protein [Burkholderia cepacia]|uniref:DUF3164 family protein n=1 Tax=Burkholderia cepacia TaxID=292 RepID=UPI0026DFBE13|nr:DUF3164 family protein [Burkholderia cepacia]MDO5940608.1 DUF3164 family protein [Burkholderia cepacia]